MTTTAPRNDVDLGTGAPIARITVPITLDHRFDRGVSVAVRLAERWAIPIHLVSVQTGVAGAVDLAAGEALESARAALRSGHPLIPVTDEIIGADADAVAALTSSLEPEDLVVMATAADASRNWPSFGLQLATAWSGPIVLVGPNAVIDRFGGDVVIGLDGSALAERALPAAAGLAAALGSHLWVVQVVPGSVTAHVERLRERGEAVSENGYIRDVIERMDFSAATWEIVHAEDAAAALAQFAATHDVAALVLATHGASGIPRQVFGSTTLEAVRNSTRPVVSIRGAKAGSEIMLG